MGGILRIIVNMTAGILAIICGLILLSGLMVMLPYAVMTQMEHPLYLRILMAAACMMFGSVIICQISEESKD